MCRILLSLTCCTFSFLSSLASLAFAPLCLTKNQKVYSIKKFSSAAGQNTSSTVFNEFAEFLLDIQSKICNQAEEADGSGEKFCIDRWERSSGSRGEGITRVLEGGKLLEKAAASVSIIHGTLTSDRAKSMSSRGREGIDIGGGQSYSAAALSLVFHSQSPLVPTFRSDVRLFEVAGQLWYGGGADLTPFYLFDEDIIEFHSMYRDICNKHGTSEDYFKFKNWADQYFFIPMREEHRGVGGIFFDDLDSIGQEKVGNSDVDQLKAADNFVRDVAECFMPSYLPIALRRGSEAYSKEQREWQLLRRGRYLEFNLLYDRGVKFGLTGGGRVESIMVSAPPLVRWKYSSSEQEQMDRLDSNQQRLLRILKKPIDWLDH